MGNWECIGAFSDKEDAKQCFEGACNQWQATDGINQSVDKFPSTYLQQSWSDFTRGVMEYSVGKIAAKLITLARHRDDQ
jgi:hypothetical protein